MKKFYLSKNASGYYRVHFIDPVTGKQGTGKSTHTKDKVEAAMIAALWLKDGAPLAASHSHHFKNDECKKVSVLENKNLYQPLSQLKKIYEQNRIKLCSFLYEFWDYEKSDFIKRRIAHGYTISKKHTINMQIFVKKYWFPYFGEQKYLDDLSKSELEEFFFYLNTEVGLSGETVNKIINCASRATRWLFNNEKINKNPLLGVERFRSNNKKRGIPTEREVKLLLDHQWHNFTGKLAFQLAAFCGLRAGEISALRVCDLDITKDILHIRHSWSEVDGLKNTKNTDERDLPLDHKISLQLYSLARHNPYFSENSFIFYAPKNPSKPFYPGYYGDIFYKAMEEIGINKSERKRRNIVFHSLRHFCATMLIQKADLQLVKSILGHRTEIMSELYSQHECEEKFNNKRDIMNMAWSQFITIQ